MGKELEAVEITNLSLLGAEPWMTGKIQPASHRMATTAGVFFLLGASHVSPSPSVILFVIGLVLV